MVNIILFTPLQHILCIVPDKPQFVQQEEQIITFWREIDAFQRQLELTKNKPEFTFYDGPPFATGLPHYGHITAGTIKDVVTRYASMNGFHVERRFGWDCHGLPIEYEIDKKHNIKSSDQREDIGVKQYNKMCREIVMTYSKEWENTVERFGRWIDFQNGYKTMDSRYMESVWWTFKNIWDQDLVYKGSRVMPFSTACNTVLSNFEASSNYQNVTCPSIFVSFPLEEDPQTSIIAWSTTPWTLPSNIALAMNPNFKYVKILDKDTGRQFILAQVRLKEALKQTNIKKHEILQVYSAQELAGKRYIPLYEYFGHMRSQGYFQVILANFVTDDAGTGVVQVSPGFGEDDYQASIACGLIQPGKAPCPIDLDGRYTDPISNYKGMYVKDADDAIKTELKQKGRIVAMGTITHNYPFCWRSNTPLLYRAVDTWFIKVTKIKEQLIQNNKNTKWVPSFISEKRFHNWLMEAKDWCFSRNRYWGNPIPLWISDDGEEVVCVGSIKELIDLSGCGEITDLHREYIDHITIPSKQGKGVLKRIPEVFDCWFESGSMPFAQQHYPFSITDEKFNKGFPANFIGEGLDQTRGWFYTLMVISTAVKGIAPFQNVIVNGIVLAEDGSKMSKSKKNYPDPSVIANTYGADACRLYLCSSPLVRAEPLKFSEAGVKNIIKDVFLPFYNVYRFSIQNIQRWEKLTKQRFIFDPNLKQRICDDPNANIMDKWIIATTQHLIRLVDDEMANYKLYNVVKHIFNFLENLTNWYLRLSRSRMKGEQGYEDQYVSLNILFEVILNTSILMAFITPFLSEFMYQNLKNGISKDSQYYQDSIHFLQIPRHAQSLINEQIEQLVLTMQCIIELGRKIRDNKKISLKTPLQKIIVIESNQDVVQDLQKVQQYIKDELNCLQVEFDTNETEYVLYKSEPDNELCGQNLKHSYGKLKATLQSLPRDQILSYFENKQLVVEGHVIKENWLKISKLFNEKYAKHSEYGVESNLSASVMLTTTITDDLKEMGIAREIVNDIQQQRKKLGLNIDDNVEIFYSHRNNQNSLLTLVLNKHIEGIKKQLRTPFLDEKYKQNYFVVVGKSEYHCYGEVLHIVICVPAVTFNDAELNHKYANTGDLSTFVNDLKSFVLAHDQQSFMNKVENNNGIFRFKLNGYEVLLTHKVDFYFNAHDQSINCTQQI